jgi:O-antigen/teichoic acid export membrane protein
MNATGRRIAKNATVLMASQVVTWALSLALTLFLPRYLGPAGFGEFRLAVSIWALMAVVIAFGMDTLLIKETSRDPSQLAGLFSTSIVLRVGIFLVSTVIVALYALAAGYPRETLQVIFVVGLSTFVGQLAATCAAALQGLERMEYLSLGSIAGQAVATGAGIVLLLSGYRVVAFALVYLASAVIALTVQWIALQRLHPLHLELDRNRLSWMLRASFPYLLVFGFLVAYNQVDVLIMSWLVSPAQIGWYSAANNLFGTFLFIPTVFLSAILPALSRMHKQSPEAMPQFLSRSFNLLLMMGVPLGLGVMAVANPLVVLLFGPAFTNSGPILMVMGLVLIFTYQNIALGQFFISSDRQSVWIAVMAVATLLAIPLDLVLIPWCQSAFGNGALGGACSYLVTEAGMLVYGLVMMPKGALGWKNGWLALRVVVAGLAMAIVIWWLRGLFIVAAIAIGLAVELAFVISLRVIVPEDWALVRALATGALGWLRLKTVRSPNRSQSPQG